MSEDAESKVTAPRKNPHELHCPWCDCTVMLANVADEVERDIRLHKPSAEEETFETYTKHWSVSTRFAFENVGVSRPLDKGDTTYRYLTCAECDKGPIGAKLATEELYFVSQDIIKEKEKE